MIKKAISLTILLCFLVTEATWAIPTGGISVLPKLESPGFLNVEIPKNLASLEEMYEAPGTTDPKLILHIQDLHGSFEAQRQIKNILDYLYSKYAFNLIFVEGAVDEINPEQLRLFPDPERNKKLAEALAKEGEVTGAELFMMSGPENVDAVGIEQADLYRRNLEAFKEIHSHREQIDGFLNQLTQRFETLSSRYFSRDMRRLLSDWKKFEKGHRDFLPYVRRLSEDSKKFIGLDLESLFAQVEWPQITRLLVLQAMETDLDKPQYEKERQLLIQFLREAKASEILVGAVEKLGNQQITMSRLDSEQAKLEHLPRYLLERLVDEVGAKGFYFHDYPAFSLYAGYMILKYELDSKILFEEIKRVFKKILNELAVSEQEKNLLELHRDEELLRKLLHLELSRKEWAQASYRKEWITPEVMIKRLVTIHETGEKLLHNNEEKLVNVEGDLMASMFETAYRFYDYARERDSVFYDTIEREMEQRKLEKAVLITGGFHTEGITDLFRDHSLNYGVLMPKVRGDLGKETYLQAMMETKETFFDLNAIVKALLTRDRQKEILQGGPAAGMGTSDAFVGGRVIEWFTEILAESPDREDVVGSLKGLDAKKDGLFRKLGNRSQIIDVSDNHVRARIWQSNDPGDKFTHSVYDAIFKTDGDRHKLMRKGRAYEPPPDDADDTFQLVVDPVETAAIPDVIETRSEARQTVFNPQILRDLNIQLSDLSKVARKIDRDRKFYAWTPSPGKLAATLKIGGSNVVTRLLSREDGFVEDIAVQEPASFYQDLQGAEEPPPSKNIEELVLDEMARQFQTVINMHLSKHELDLQQVHLSADELTAAGVNPDLVFASLIKAIRDIEVLGISTHGPFIDANEDESGTYEKDSPTVPFLKGTSLRKEISDRLIRIYPLFKERGPDYFARKISVKRDYVASAEGEMSDYGTVAGKKDLLYVSWGSEIGASLHKGGQAFRGDDYQNPMSLQVGKNIVWSPETGNYEYVGLMEDEVKETYKEQYANANEHFSVDRIADYFGAKGFETLAPDEMIKAGMDFGRVLGTYLKGLYAQYQGRAIPADVIVGSYVAHQGIYHPYLLDAIKEGYHQEINRPFTHELGYMHGLQRKHHKIIASIKDKNKKVRSDKIEAILAQRFGVFYAKMYMMADDEMLDQEPEALETLKTIQARDAKAQVAINQLQRMDSAQIPDRPLTHAIAALETHNYRKAIEHLKDALKFAITDSQQDEIKAKIEEKLERKRNLGAVIEALRSDIQSLNDITGQSRNEAVRYTYEMERILRLIESNKQFFTELPYLTREADYRELKRWETLVPEDASLEEKDKAVGRILNGVELIIRTDKNLRAEHADAAEAAKWERGIINTASAVLERIRGLFNVVVENYPMLGWVEKVDRDTGAVGHRIGHVDLSLPIKDILEKTKATRPTQESDDPEASDVTLLSGGTGAPKLLGWVFRALNYVAALIQSNLDDGGSSGDIVRLLRDKGYGIFPPPGDLVNALFTGYAHQYQLSGILGDNGRLYPKIKNDQGVEVDNPDYKESVYEQVRRKMERNRQDFSQEIEDEAERERFYRDFDKWEERTMELVQLAQDELWNEEESAHDVIPKKKASIRNIILLGAMKKFGLLERISDGPLYENAMAGNVEEDIFGTDANGHEVKLVEAGTPKSIVFQKVLDYVRDITGIKGVRMSISSLDPAVLYATYEDNTIRYQDEDGEWQLRLVKTVDDVVTVVVRDPTTKTVDEIIIPNGETRFIGGLLYGNLDGKATLTNGVETWAIIEHDGVNQTFLRKVDSNGQLIRPETIGKGTESDDIEIELANDGTGTKLSDGTAPTIGGRQITVRTRLTVTQDAITRLVNFSKMTDLGAVPMTEERVRIGHGLGKAPVANEAAEDIIRKTKKLFVTGPGSIGTSLRPHFLTKGTMLELMWKVDPNNPRLQNMDRFKDREKPDGKVPSIFIVNMVYDNESIGADLISMMRDVERDVTRTLMGEDFDEVAYDNDEDYREAHGVKFNEIFSHVVVNEGIAENWLPESLARKKQKELAEEREASGDGMRQEARARSEARTVSIIEPGISLPETVTETTVVNIDVVAPELVVVDDSLRYTTWLSDNNDQDIHFSEVTLDFIEDQPLYVVTAALAWGVFENGLEIPDAIETINFFVDQYNAANIPADAFAMQSVARDIAPDFATDDAGGLLEVTTSLPTEIDLAAYRNALMIQTNQQAAVVVVVPQGELAGARSEARTLVEAAAVWTDANGNGIVDKGRFRIDVTTPRRAPNVISTVSNKLNANMRSVGPLGQNLVLAFNPGTEEIMEDGVWLGTVVFNNITDPQLRGAMIGVSSRLSQAAGDAMLLNEQLREPVYVVMGMGYEFGPGLQAFADTIWTKITAVALVRQAA